MIFLQRYASALAEAIRALLIAVLLLASALMVARLLTLWGGMTADTYQSAELAKTLAMGARFDLKAAAVVFAPLWILAFFFAGLPFYSVFLTAYRYFMWLFAALLSVVNYFYIQTYATHIDVFIFGLFEGNTTAIFKTLWSDYPVLWGLLLCVLIALILEWIYQRLQSNRGIETKSKTIFFIVLSFLLVPLLARGSVGVFPLNHHAAAIAVKEELRRSVANALVAFEWALSERRNALQFPVVSHEQFAKEALAIGIDPTAQRTPRNPELAKRQPHVVVVMMEGMGADILRYDDPEQLDLLGQLRPHTQEDFWFKRFLAATDGTLSSLLNLLTQNPQGLVSQSIFRRTPMLDTAVQPYVEAGYELVFVTGQSLGWRRHGDYLGVQGFKRQIGREIIAQSGVPSANWQGPWGVSDKAVFQYVEQYLDQAIAPTLMVVNTTTNHSPYAVPPDGVERDFKLNQSLLQSFNFGARELQLRLNTYRYAASALGDFMSLLKTKKNQRPTIVAATGDHRLRGFSKTERNLASFYSVPLYLYLPQVLRQSLDLDYQPLRVGSHKDVFPTLYALSLSDARFKHFGGRNLLANIDNPQRAFAYHQKMMFLPEGVVETSRPEVLLPWASAYRVEHSEMENPRPLLAKSFGEIQRLRTAMILAKSAP